MLFSTHRILFNRPTTRFSSPFSLTHRINMADIKSQDKNLTTSEVEAKKADPLSDSTTQADSGDNKKAEDATAADAGSTTSQSRPTRHLPTHYKGMPKQWEKNQVPKKDT